MVVGGYVLSAFHLLANLVVRKRLEVRVSVDADVNLKSPNVFEASVAVAMQVPRT